MEPMTHLISLGVGTSNPEAHAQTYQDMSELARNLAVSHDYVSLTTQFVGGDEDDDDEGVDEDFDCAFEHLRHDENTIVKVREALRRSIMGLTDDVATSIIGEIQNAGILFRERGEI